MLNFLTNGNKDKEIVLWCIWYNIWEIVYFLDNGFDLMYLREIKSFEMMLWICWWNPCYEMRLDLINNFNEINDYLIKMWIDDNVFWLSRYKKVLFNKDLLSK